MSNIPAVGDKITAAWGDLIAQPIEGETTTGANVTLSTTSLFASTATATFTLTAQMRVRIDVQVLYTLAAGVAGRYGVQAGYNSGAAAAIGSFLGVGKEYLSAGSIAGGLSGSAFGTVLLAAGQYTAYMSIRRFSGGSATDTAGSFELLVTTLGFA